MLNPTDSNFYWQDVNGSVYNLRDPQGKRLCIVSRNQTSGLFRIFYEFGTGEPRTSLDLISAQKLPS